MEDTPALLRRYSEEQSQSAFAAFVYRHFDPVYSTALRRCNGRADIAKDAAQEVFIKAARHAAQLSRHPAPSAWLYATARNATLNLLRAESRRRSHETTAHAMDALHPEQNPAADWSAVAPLLDASIDALSEKDRHAILLRFFDQHSFAKIAATLSLSEDAARMRVERALLKLRHLLARRGLTTSVGALGVLLSQHTVSAAPAGLAASAIPTALSTSASSPTILTWLGAKNLLAPAALALISLLITTALFIDVAHTRATTARIQISEETEIAHLESALRVLASTDRHLSSAATPALAPPQQPATTPHLLGGGRRLFLSSAYQPLYRSLALTDAEIRRFEELSLEGPDTGLWLSIQESSQPPTTSTSFRPQHEIDAQLAALLGPEGYSEYHSFARTVPARSFAALLAGSVYLTDPLSPEAGEKLAQAISHASTSFRNGGSVSLDDINWDHVLQTTQPVLTDSQRSALNALRIRQAVERALTPHLTDRHLSGAALLPGTARLHR